ncbi:hypothetical protein [Parasutterella excrementihominis]|uniref:hypothetical protein n=1 Tax=Parasutterella excrementihominis TaxID=487175 RepID=UPI00351FC29F
MSHRVEFVWHDHECYKVQFDGETICTLYKTSDGYWTLRPDAQLGSELEAVITDYWELLSEAKIAIRRALKSYSR